MHRNKQITHLIHLKFHLVNLEVSNALKAWTKITSFKDWLYQNYIFINSNCYKKLRYIVNIRITPVTTQNYNLTTNN